MNSIIEVYLEKMIKAKQTIHALLLLKTFEGGTGSFAKDIKQIEKEKNPSIKLKSASLEDTFYSNSFSQADYHFLNNKNYPEIYSVTYKNIFLFTRELHWLKNIVKKEEPQVLISVDSHCLILAYLAKQIFGFKYKIIATIHNNIEEVINYKIKSLHRKIFILVFRYFLMRVDTLVVVSQGIADNMKRLFKLPKIPVVIYYGIQKREYKENFLKNGAKKILLSVGRLSEQKDFATILYAFSLIKKTMESELWIVGDGHLKESLIEYANNLGIQKQVKFFGWKTDTSTYYKRADLFLFSSKWEGFGHVILEAMNYGLPVIATDTPFGPRELLGGKNGYGILVSFSNAQEMAHAIDSVMGNPDLLKKFRNRSLVRVSNFSMQKTISEYRALISQTL